MESTLLIFATLRGHTLQYGLVTIDKFRNSQQYDFSIYSKNNTPSTRMAKPVKFWKNMRQYSTHSNGTQFVRKSQYGSNLLNAYSAMCTVSLKAIKTVRVVAYTRPAHVSGASLVSFAVV